MNISRTAKWLAAAGVLSFLCACTDEGSLQDYSPASPDSDEIGTVIVDLSREGYADIATRSSFIWSDTDIKDIELVVTDESGNVKKVLYSTSTSSLSFIGTVGHTYNVWAAANIGGKINVSALSDFTSGKRSVKYSEIASRGIPMYSVDGSGQPGPATVTVEKGGSHLTVYLERMMAKVSFRVDKSKLDNPSSFTVKGVKIYNAINSYSPFTSDVKQAHSGSVDHSFDKASSSDISALNGGSAIDLYAFENMQGTLLPGNSDPWKKVPSQIIGSADYCTYLEMDCSYASGGKTFNKVSYRMYLGDDATTNFDVKRNTRYAVTLIPTEAEIDGHSGSWKVETSDWDDERSLEFSSKSVTLDCLQSGSVSIVRSPSDLEYDFSYDTVDAAAAGVTITRTGDVVSIVNNVELAEAKTVTLHVETPDGVHEDDCVITVNPKAVEVSYELELTPSEQTITENGSPASITAMYYTLNNGVRVGSGQDVTNSATWSVVDGGQYIEYASKGSYRWKAGEGVAHVKAVYEGKEAVATINTSAHEAVEGKDYEIAVSANPETIKVNGTTTLSAVLYEYRTLDGVRTGSPKTISGVSFTWTSRDKSVLTVSGSTGTGVGAGTAKVYATCSYMGHDYQSDDLTVAVGNDVRYELEITPSEQTINEGQTAVLTATYYVVTNGSRNEGTDVTAISSTVWSIESGDAYIVPVSGTKGKYRWLSGAGTATVKATYNGKSATATIRTTEHEVIIDYELELTPAEQTISENGNPASVTAKYYTLNDGERVGSGQVVTNSADWSVVSGSQYVEYAGKGSYAWKAGEGEAVVKAVYNGKSATAIIYTDAHVPVITYELEVSPASSTIAEGESAQLTATYYTLTDGTRDSGRNVTASATWSVTSGSQYVREVSGTKGKYAWNAGDGESTVKAVYGSGGARAEGSAKIYTGSHVPVVTHRIEITPKSKDLAEGESVQFTVKYYTITDGIEDGGVDVTASAAWSVTSGTQYVREVSGTKGKYAWAGGAGTATVKVTYDGETDTATVNTSAHVPVETYDYELVFSADPETINVTETTSLSAALIMHRYLDGEEVGTGTEVSGVTKTFKSRNTGVLSISGSTGTGVSAGTANVYVTCKYQGDTYTSDDIVITVNNGVNYEIVVYGDITFDLVAGEDAPASGGNTGKCTVRNVKQEKWTRTYYYDGTYTDRNHTTVTLQSGSYTAYYSKSSSSGYSTTCPTYSGSNLGTTEKARTKLGTIYAYVTANDVTSDKENADLYQEHNIIEDTDEISRVPNSKQYGDWEVVGTDDYVVSNSHYVSIDAEDYTSLATAAPASGGSTNLIISSGHKEYTVTRYKRDWSQTAQVTERDTYTSTATKDRTYTDDYDSGTEEKDENGDPYDVADDYSISDPIFSDGFTRSGTAVTIASEGTTVRENGRSVTYTIKNKKKTSVTDAVTIYQEPNVIVETIPLHYEYRNYRISVSPDEFGKGGGQGSISASVEYKLILEKSIYTSGKSTGGSEGDWSTGTTISYLPQTMNLKSGSDVLTYDAFSASYPGMYKVNVPANSGSARQWKISGTFEGLESNTVTLTQEDGSVTITGIDLVMAPATINIGGTSTGTVTVHYSDGTSENVSNSACTWSIQSGNCGSVNGSGVFTGTSVGTATVKVSYGGCTDTATVTVEKSVDHISLTMSPDDIAVGETSTGTVTVYWTDGTHNVVSNSDCSWTITSGSSCGNLSNRGVFTGKAEGTATIKATYQGCSDTDTVTVSDYDIHVD